MERLQYAVYLLLFVSLSICTLYLAREFLVPLALAGILSMLFVKMCNRIERRGVNRGLSSLFAIMLFILSVSVLFVLLTWQLKDFTDNIDEMKRHLTSAFQSLKDWVDQKIGISSGKQEQMIKEQSQSGETNTGGMLFKFASGTVDILVSSILVIVYMYLFLFLRQRIKNFILRVVPKRDSGRSEEILKQCTEVSQQYLGGLSAMIVLLWVLYSIGFSLVGVENAIFFAVICGTLEIVPFVGNITGTAITVLAVVAQGSNDKILSVIGVYLIVQFVQTYLIEPLVVGDQVNINPLFTIAALVAGEQIWGIGGMILAIPLLGIVKIICDNVPSLQPYGYLIGTDKKSRKGLKEKMKGLRSKKS